MTRLRRYGFVAFAVAGSVMSAATASAATEQLPLRFGAASISVGMDGARVWNPQAFRALHIRVQARVRPAQRSTHRAYVRYHAGAKSCGPSHARGRGTAYGPISAFTGDAQGYFGGRMGRAVTIKHVGNVRFCVWVAASPRSVVRPTVQDIPFHAVLFGASITATGSFWKPPIFTTWHAVGTQPFTSTRSGFGCRGAPEPTTTETSDLNPVTSLAGAGAGTGNLGLDDCNETISVAFRLLGGFADQLDQGSFSLTGAERRLVPAPIKHLGNACVFDPALFRNVDEAKAYVRAVGCIPGRVLRNPQSGDHGMVVDFRIRGARAIIAAPDTTVDLVVAVPR